MGGSIAVESMKSVGSKFILRFPLVEGGLGE
jgi:signal transduction histidine kinase